MRTRIRERVTCAVGLGALFVFVLTSPAFAKHPNVLLIMTDDVGYGDIGCYGATQVRTPNVDRLAHEGLRFTSGYCTSATCTPSRYSMLTGEYAWRKPGTGIAPPNATAIIQPGTTTLASIFDDAGYATGVVGKWHLGLGKNSKPDWSGELNPGPLEIGFDYCFIMPTTGDRVPCVYVENHRIAGLEANDPVDVFQGKNPDGQPTGITHRDSLKMDWSHGHNQSIVNGISRIGFMTGGHAARWVDEDMADVFTKQAVAFIEQNHEQPFFLFFATHDIHVPRMPHPRFQGKSGCGYRGDALEQMDWSVGKLLDTLDRFNLTNDTLVIFCSDNGPVLDDGYKDGAVEKLHGHQPAGPLRGGKYSHYEGGTRTPMITRWPGNISQGESSEIVCSVDFVASFAAMLGSKLPAEAAPDSFNVLDSLLGKEDAKGREYLVEQGTRTLGLRVGEWKLVEQRRSKKDRQQQVRAG
ncbi:MAG: arylsulfatase, partial [Planctomycetales bacterium]|nr:arylsulfatase [Planctomycetales bacterium]